MLIFFLFLIEIFVFVLVIGQRDQGCDRDVVVPATERIRDGVSDLGRWVRGVSSDRGGGARESRGVRRGDHGLRAASFFTGEIHNLGFHRSRNSCSIRSLSHCLIMLW